MYIQTCQVHPYSVIYRLSSHVPPQGYAESGDQLPTWEARWEGFAWCTVTEGREEVVMNRDDEG